MATWLKSKVVQSRHSGSLVQLHCFGFRVEDFGVRGVWAEGSSQRYGFCTVFLML